MSDLLILNDISHAASTVSDAVSSKVTSAVNKVNSTISSVGGAISTVEQAVSEVTVSSVSGYAESLLSDAGNALLNAATGAANAAYVNSLDMITNALAGVNPESDHSVYGVNTKLLGAPPRWSASCDPGGRIYMSKILPHAIICNVVPGKLIVPPTSLALEKYEKAKTLVRTSEDATAVKTGLYSDDRAPSVNPYYYEDSNPDTAAITKARDLRMCAFSSDWLTYRDCLNVLASTIFSVLGGLTFQNTRITSYLDMSDMVLGEGFHYYCQNGTTGAESFSNEVGQSALQAATSSVSNAAKEFNFLTGKSDRNTGNAEWTSGTEATAEDGSMLKGVAQAGQETLGKVAGFFSENAEQLVLGENLIYPQIAKGSRTVRSINLSIEFRAANPDPISVAEQVILPALTWLPMIAPIQYKPSSYTTPMLVRCESPGRFVIDFGLVTGVTMVKGGSKKLFTADGLPKSITMDISITDLYPILTTPANIAVLEGSIGTQVWLHNLAGLLMTRLNFEEQFKTAVYGRMYQMAGKVSVDRLAAGAGDRISKSFARL